MTDNEPSQLDASVPDAPHGRGYKAVMWTGLGLMLLTAAYLCAVSVMAKVAKGTLESLLHCDAEDVYSHPLLVVLFMLVGLSMLLATLLYVRMDLARAGAWISHAGVITLIVGAAGYSLLAQRGQCISELIDDDIAKAPYWSPIDYFRPIHGEQLGPPVPLGQRLQILETLYLSHGSMPEDFICKVRVGEGPGAPVQTLNLNNPIFVGQFHITQGSWFPDPEHPTLIVFGVASRPMIGVVWLGMGMTVAGMLFGFYIRPLLAGKGRAK